MKAKIVEITITHDGHVQTDLQGFEGKSCDGVIDDILAVVGKKVESTKKKEYFKKQKATIKNKIGKG